MSIRVGVHAGPFYASAPLNGPRRRKSPQRAAQDRKVRNTLWAIFGLGVLVILTYGLALIPMGVGYIWYVRAKARQRALQRQDHLRRQAIRARNAAIR